MSTIDQDQNTFADTVSRLPTQDTINCLEPCESSLEFDEDISDIFKLEEIHINDFCSKISAEQQEDEFCKPFWIIFNLIFFQKTQNKSLKFCITLDI